MKENPDLLAAILAEMRGNEFDDPHLNADGIIGARRLARDWADRIEAAAEREREELVKSVEELRDGMCPHCDMQHLCAEGEDGMTTTCNAMAKVNAFVARYKQRHEPNDGIPF